MGSGDWGGGGGCVGFHNGKFYVPTPGHVIKHSNTKVRDGRYAFKLSFTKGVIRPSRARSFLLWDLRHSCRNNLSCGEKQQLVIVITRTCFSIAGRSRFAGAVVRPYSVSAHSIHVTVMSVGCAFVNI